MALISCPECERQISDKAPACPHCGIPLASASPPQSDRPQPPIHVTIAAPQAAPPSEPAHAQPKKTSRTSWLVLLLVLIGAVWYFQSPTLRNQNKPDMPVRVGYRSAITGPGLVLKVENTSDRHLSIRATLKNPSLGNTQNFRLDVPPRGEVEAGYREGWTLASGDTITLTHNDYKPWDGSIP